MSAEKITLPANEPRGPLVLERSMERMEERLNVLAIQIRDTADLLQTTAPASGVAQRGGSCD
jgi:hypothetical protein